MILQSRALCMEKKSHSLGSINRNNRSSPSTLCIANATNAFLTSGESPLIISYQKTNRISRNPLPIASSPLQRGLQTPDLALRYATKALHSRNRPHSHRLQDSLLDLQGPPQMTNWWSRRRHRLWQLVLEGFRSDLQGAKI